MGIKYFKGCCDGLNIDFDNVFCSGSSKASSSINHSGRYQFQPTEKRLKQHHQFAVKYFVSEEMYLCWSRQQKVKITKFSCKKQDVLNTLEENRNYLVKNVVSRNGDKEKVYAFKKENVMDFLKYLQTNFL